MKICIDSHEGEFSGEIAKYCMDEDYIWFYDEISGGLYRLDKTIYIVDVLLTPMDIHQKEIFPVRQIVKWENKIYIIPNNISHKWLVYNIEGKRLESVQVSSQSYEIGNAVGMGEWIYLIPEKTNHMIAIVDAETLKIKMIITNWYKNNIKKLECWGHSVFEDMILLPIIDTGEIYQIQGEQISALRLYIKQSIYSISLSKDGIWILPGEGKSIFFINKNSEFIDSFEIQKIEDENAAERFARIIAVDKYAFLLPKQGGQILVLDTSNKSWTVLGNKEEAPFRSLYQKTRNLPYWGCYYNEGSLYMLPLQYRFAEINVENQSINYKVLRCADTLLEQQYISWVQWFHEKTKINMYVEWEKNSLKNFLEITLKHNLTCSTSSIGKNIWMME